MAGIDKRIIVRLDAEDTGFVSSIRRVSGELQNFSREMGRFAKFSPSSEMRKTFSGGFARGLTDELRKVTPELQRVMDTLSAARMTNGAVKGIEHIRQAHEQLSASYSKRAAIATEAAAKESAALKTLLQQEDALKTRVSALTTLMKQRSTATLAARNAARPQLAADKLALGQVQGKIATKTENISTLRGVAATYNSMAQEQAKLIQGYGALERATDTVRQAFENEISTVRKLQRLEQQRQQATDSRVTEARKAAELAKAAQDKEVRGALEAQRKIEEAQAKAAAAQKQRDDWAGASKLTKASTFLQQFAVAASKASTVFGGTIMLLQAFKGKQDALSNATSGATGKLGAFAAAAGGIGMALSRGNQESLVMSQRMMKIAVVAGVAVTAIGRIAGVLRSLIGLLARVGQSFVGFGLKATKAMVTVALKSVAALSRLLIYLGKLPGQLGKAALGFSRAHKEMQKYNNESRQTVDAEGWHSASLKGLVGNVVNMNRWINTLGASVRQMGQAFQNAGTTLSIFLSYPVSRVFGGMWNQVLAFDKSLIEIRKNADVALDSLDPLEYTLENISEALLDVIAQTPTSPGEIGDMAADTARLGLDPKFIAPFVQVMDQLVVATDVTADEAVDSVGRILNIFYDLSSDGVKDVDTFMQYTRGLGSAINELGQANPVGESGIIAALLRVAPAAAAIEMPLEDVIGLAASVASASASSERAGTQLNSALTYMAKNIEKVAAASGAEIKILEDFANTDPTETFLAIVNAIAEIPEPIARTNAALQLFGQIGGKATNTLGASFDKVIENVALSREAFKDGMSLALEFERALDAVSNQIGLLKNQFSVMGIALGEAFLPVITQLLSYMVPLTMAISRMFKTLDNRVKLTIVGVLGFIAIVGPLLYALGSIMFSIGILTTGLTGFITVIGGLLKIPLTLGTALLGLLTPFGLLKTAIFAAIGMLVFFGDSMIAVQGIIASVATSMYAWGYNMFMSFADGIYNAASAVINAVFDTLSAVAAMLRSFSPPREGPLKDIDKWGRNIATTFADAFALADLSGIRVFANNIRASLEGMIRDLDVTGVSLFGDIFSDMESIVNLIGTDVRQAATALIGLLHTVQTGTGDINEDFEALAAVLGPFAADFTELIKLQIQYNLEVERGNEIQEQLDNLDQETEDRIKEIASDQNLTTMQRVAGIRGTRAAADRRRDELNRQLAASKEIQASFQAMIDYQKGLIDIFKKFFDQIQPGGSDRPEIEKPDKPEENDLEPISEIEVEEIKTRLEEAQTATSEAFAKMIEDGGRFVKQMSDAKSAIVGFIDGITGAYVEIEQGMNSKAYLDAYKQGQVWRDGILSWLDDLGRKLDTAIEFIDAFIGVFYILALAANNGENPGFGTNQQLTAAMKYFGEHLTLLLNIGAAFKTIKDAAVEYFGYLATLFAGWKEGASPLQVIIGGVQDFIKGVQDGFSDDSPLVKNAQLILAPIKSIADSLVIIAGLVFTNLDVIGEFFGNLAGWLASSTGYIGIVLELFKAIAGFGDPENLKKNIELTGNTWLLDLFDVDNLEPDTMVQQIIDNIASAIDAGDFTAVGAALGKQLNNVVFGSVDTETGQRTGGIFSSILPAEGPGGAGDPSGGIAVFVQGLVNLVAGALSQVDTTELLASIASFFGGIFVGLTDEDSMTAISTALGMFIANIINLIPAEEFIGAAVAIVNGIVRGINESVKSKELDEGLKGIASALVNGLASVDFAFAAETVTLFIGKIIDALSSQPWGNIADPITKFIDKLLSVLSSEEAWSKAGDLLGQIATAIADGILNADWGTLFSWEKLDGIVKALLGGIEEGIIKAKADERKAKYGYGDSIESQEEGVELFEHLYAMYINDTDNRELGRAVIDVGMLIAEYEATLRSGEYTPYELDEKLMYVADLLQGARDQQTTDELRSGFSTGMGLFGFDVYGSPDQPGGQESDSSDFWQWFGEGFMQMLFPSEPVKAADDGSSANLVQSNATSLAMSGLVTGMNTWAIENAQALKDIGDAIVIQIFTGFTLSAKLYADATYGSIIYNFGVWFDTYKTNITAQGDKIGKAIGDGIANHFGEDAKYFDAITKRFSDFVDEIDETHEIYKDAMLLGEKIDQAISDGLVNNWPKIRDGILSAISIAIKNISINTNAPPVGGAEGSGAPPVSNSSSSSYTPPPAGSTTYSGTPTINPATGLPWFINPETNAPWGRSGAVDPGVVGASFGASGYGNLTTSPVVINFNGDVVVDNQKRINDLTDKISRELGKRSRLLAVVR